MRRKALNGTYSPPTSEDESEDDRQNYRTVRQGGRPRRKVPERRRESTESDMDEDPCGVRHKRTFFRSSDAKLRKQMGLTAAANTNVLSNGDGASEGPSRDDVRMDGTSSRAVTPVASVV